MGLHLLGPALLIAFLAAPLIGAPFPAFDWHEHVWYVWHQSESIRANGIPSLFAHNTAAMFNAHFAFYGGSLYASAGALALILGSPQAAFDVFWIAAFAMAYGGWFWMARMAGLGLWTSHVPGVLFITSPYYLTMVYRAGAWPELIAVSGIPLLLASGLSVVQDSRLHLMPALALAATAILVTGSHSITLIWAPSFLIAVALAIAVLVPEARRRLTRRGLLRALGVFVPAVLVNGWFLLPAAAYQSMTYIAGFPARANLEWAGDFLTTHYLFSLGRPASPPRLMVLALPVLAIVWIALSLIVARAAWRTAWFRTVAILLCAIGALVVLMRSVALMLALPSPLDHVQFGYRLESYILIGVSAASIGALRLVDRGSRTRAVWRWAGLALIVVMVGQALGQAHPNPNPSLDAGDSYGFKPYRTPHPYASEMDYSPRHLRLYHTKGVAEANFPASAERGNRATVIVDAKPGQRVITNAMLMPPLVKVEGARIMGMDRIGQAMLQVDRDATPGAAQITVSAARPWPVVLGDALTLIGLLGLFANAILLMHQAHRRKQTPDRVAAVAS